MSFSRYFFMFVLMYLCRCFFLPGVISLSRYSLLLFVRYFFSYLVISLLI